MFRIHAFILFLIALTCAKAFAPQRFGARKLVNFRMSDEESPSEEAAGSTEVTSPEIISLRKKIENTNSMISQVKEDRKKEEEEFAQLDAEFGSEITRIKKEFARIKERAVEEAQEASYKAKADALKEVLPVTDNYFRARGIFVPTATENEAKILNTYDDIFAKFQNVIEGFGVTRVVSLGQPFDFNFMEAIMTAPSTEYSADLVCTEYQVGYKMGERCIRPAMVVVSTGPGPAK